MNLNGQCEKAFNAWLEIEYEAKRIEFPLYDNLLPCYHGMNFQSLPHEMQHGVKVKFFDSVGINIWTYSSNKDDWWGAILTESRFLKSISADTRHEAQTKAEQKANDIYNENN